MLSNSCKYAIRSVIYLALHSNSGNKIGSRTVASKLNIPLDIVDCIDGLDAFNLCFFGLRSCTNEKPCSVHNTVKPFKDEIFLQLSKNTIKQFADEIRTGKSFISLEEI